MKPKHQLLAALLAALVFTLPAFAVINHYNKKALAVWSAPTVEPKDDTGEYKQSECVKHILRWYHNGEDPFRLVLPDGWHLMEIHDGLDYVLISREVCE